MQYVKLFVKKALMKKLKSAFCWQITGLIQRLLKNNVEAAKCYTQALKFEPNNIQVLRDSCNLFLHSRELKLHKEMRRKFLLSKAGILANYSGFALACHLTGDLVEANEAIDSLLELAHVDRSVTQIDYTNIFIYKAQLLREMGKHQELLDMINTNEDKILTTTFKLESRAWGYLKLNQFSKARIEIDKLLKLRPDNEQYINWHTESYPHQSREYVLSNLRQVHPTRFLEFLILRETTDMKLFQEIFTNELIDNCRRFIPSFFKSFRQVCLNEQKQKLMQSILEDALQTFKQTKKIFAHLESENDPTAELFLLFTLASFYLQAKNYQSALQMCMDAIKHTPTFEDAHMLESKILKKAGCYALAATKANYWYKINYGDKGLNTQAVQILIKANENIQGDELFKRFIKDDKLAEKNIHELQMMNYELSLATSYSQETKWPYSIALLQIAEKNIEEIYEDQYDFYSFCLRKYTLLPLFEALKFNDVSFKASKLYLRVYQKCYYSLTMQQNYQAWENEHLKSLGTDDERKSFCDQRDLTLKLNTIEVPDELRTTIDLDGSTYLKNVDFQKRRNELAVNLNKVVVSSVKDSLKAKVYKMLLWHSNWSNDIKAMFTHFERLSLLQQSLVDLQFWAEVITQKVLKNQEGLNEEQIFELLTKLNLTKIKNEIPFSDDEIVSTLRQILLDSVKNGCTKIELSNKVGVFLENLLENGFQDFSFEKKKFILKLAKDHCFDRSIVLKVVQAKKENAISQ